MATAEMAAPSGVSRRALLVGGAAASVALGVPVAGAVPGPSRAKRQSDANLPTARIGAQLFSVSDQASDIGFPKLFAALADIGFRYVEFAGYGNKDDLSPKAIRRALDDHGLKAVGNHGSMDDASIDGALHTGQPFTGVAVLTNIHGAHKDAWKQTAGELNAFGEKCKKAGLRGFYVHMHGPEYTRVADDPNSHVIDVLLAETDPEVVFWEMDIYWAYFFQAYLDAGGTLQDPVHWVRENPKRFPLFHVKDGKDAVNQNGVRFANEGTFPLSDGICDVGQGHVPFKNFFHELAKVSDLRDHYFLWERDTASSHPHGSLASARCSYELIANGRLVDPKTAY